MKVLAVCTYPVDAAATRYRLVQFIAPLADNGIELTVVPFLNGSQFANLYKAGHPIRKAVSLAPALIDRVVRIASVSKFDVLLVQREAMLFGPVFFERIYRSIGKIPLVLDLDDATYAAYKSPNFGSVAAYLKFFGKTDRLIEMSELVICGNRFIADYVGNKGKQTVVIPTITDPNLFPEKKPNEGKLIVGWIGTKSTFPFLQKLLPVLSQLAAKHEFTLKVVGAGQDVETIPGLEVQNVEWRLEREIDDLISFDIGLYPIDTQGSVDKRWLEGKSGFKAIQYFAAGVPFVMTPIGVCAEIGIIGETHFNAVTPEDWYHHLDHLLSDTRLRTTMGAAGRKHSLETYDLESHVNKLEKALRMVVKI